MISNRTTHTTPTRKTLQQETFPNCPEFVLQYLKVFKIDFTAHELHSVLMKSSVSLTIYLDFKGRKTNLTPKLNVPFESFYSEKTFSEPAKIEPTENPPSKQVCVTFIQNRCIFKSPRTVTGTAVVTL